MSLPTITNPNPIQVIAKEFSNYYIVALDMTEPRLRITFRPYNAETQELIDTSKYDVQVYVQDIWATAYQFSAFAGVLVNLTQVANLMLQRQLLEDQKRVGPGQVLAQELLDQINLQLVEIDSQLNPV